MKPIDNSAILNESYALLVKKESKNIGSLLGNEVKVLEKHSLTPHEVKRFTIVSFHHIFNISAFALSLGTICYLPILVIPAAICYVSLTITHFVLKFLDKELDLDKEEIRSATEKSFSNCPLSKIFIECRKHNISSEKVIGYNLLGFDSEEKYAAYKVFAEEATKIIKLSTKFAQSARKDFVEKALQDLDISLSKGAV